jgi:hypothetical protein
MPTGRSPPERPRGVCRELLPYLEPAASERVAVGMLFVEVFIEVPS